MKYVENYFIEYYSSGIIHLLINTKERYLYNHDYNEHMYYICKHEESEEYNEEYILEIPENKLVLDKSKSYLATRTQNKDQISIYFLPFDIITEPDTRIFSEDI